MYLAGKYAKELKMRCARRACRTPLIGLSLVAKYEFQMDFVLFQFILTFCIYVCMAMDE